MTITLTREEAQQVLDALETITSCSKPRSYYCSFAVEIETLRAKLSEPMIDGWPLYSGLPQPEPVAYMDSKGYLYNSTTHPENYTPLYTAPPQREWQGLTEEEMAAAWSQSKGDVLQRLKPFSHAIEAKLKEKNT